MTKAITATCENGTVKVGNLTIEGAIILTAGVGSSEGLLFIDRDQMYYVATNTTDLETTIEKIIDTITKIGTILTSIGAGMTGPTTAPPLTLATDIVELNGIASELTELKGALK